MLKWLHLRVLPSEKRATLSSFCVSSCSNLRSNLVHNLTTFNKVTLIYSSIIITVAVWWICDQVLLLVLGLLLVLTFSYVIKTSMAFYFYTCNKCNKYMMCICVWIIMIPVATACLSGKKPDWSCKHLLMSGITSWRIPMVTIINTDYYYYYYHCIVWGIKGKEE